MDFKLKAEKREIKEKLNSESIPAVLYGNGLETKSLKLKRVDFDKIFSAAGESNLISLEVDGETSKVLVKAIQRDVLKHTVSHIDFYQVNMKEKITTEIPLHFINESKAVRELGGMLMRNLNEVAVECLPNDLVDHIDVDISVLNTFEDSIQIQDLNFPASLKVLHNNPEDMVVSVVAPKAQVEEAPAPEAAKDEAKKEEKKEETKK